MKLVRRTGRKKSMSHDTMKISPQIIISVLENIGKLPSASSTVFCLFFSKRACFLVFIMGCNAGMDCDQRNARHEAG